MRVGAAIPTSTPIFSTMPDTDMALSTFSDVGRLPKFKMAPSKPEVVAGILNSGNYPKSVSIGNVTDMSGMVVNVGIAVEIGSQATPVISIPGFGGRHLDFR